MSSLLSIPAFRCVDRLCHQSKNTERVTTHVITYTCLVLQPCACYTSGCGIRENTSVRYHML